MANEQTEAQQKQPEYEVQISGEGVSVKRVVPEPMARQLINMLLSGNPGPVPVLPLAPIPSAAGSPASPLAQRSEKVSLTEWMDEINAKRIPEKILAMAVFITDITSQNPNRTFTRNDIRPCFRLAREAEPGNFSRDFAVAQQFGWIAPEGADPNVFFVTRKGYTAIEQRFSTAKPFPRANKRRGRGAEAAEASDESESDGREETTS